MDESKKKKLEVAGWRFGDTKEFLNLSDEEAEYIEIKLILSRHLKMQRKRHNLTQEKAAKLLKSSQSRLAKMEAADNSVSIDLLIRSLLALGVRSKSIFKLIDG